MKKIPLNLEDSCLIKQSRHNDKRGFFMRLFSKKDLNSNGINFDIAQVNYSLSLAKGTIRGLHYQIFPKQESKILKCVAGSVFDVIVDLRKSSPTFLKWHGENLDYSSDDMIYVPKGFAHAIQSLEDNTEVIYFSSTEYSKEHERQIKFDDPKLNIKWPISPAILSPKDNTNSYLPNDLSKFKI
tara:strand:+ start:176 stop:727 length:552 start_codon:yes stop_codon:yes gene_type:complete